VTAEHLLETTPIFSRLNPADRASVAVERRRASDARLPAITFP
jgi:hypothetical protein